MQNTRDGLLLLWRKQVAMEIPPSSPDLILFILLPHTHEHTNLPLFFQGVLVELMCRPASAGFDLDVCSAGHDRQALHPLSDPVCRL